MENFKKLAVNTQLTQIGKLGGCCKTENALYKLCFLSLRIPDSCDVAFHWKIGIFKMENEK